MATVLKRSETSNQESLAVYDGARTTTWLLPPEGHSVLEVQKTKNAAQWKDVPKDKNFLIPPYHWHWYQTEYFEIKKGRYIFTLEGIDTIHDTIIDPHIIIQPEARHTFRVDPSYDGECEIHISASGGEAGIDERFFRNLYSYLDDCQKQGIKPSLPQLLLFLDSAEVSLAFPGPGRWARLLSWGFGVVVGRWYGGWWLGLKDSYVEYYDSGMVKTT